MSRGGPLEIALGRLLTRGCAVCAALLAPAVALRGAAPETASVLTAAGLGVLLLLPAAGAVLLARGYWRMGRRWLSLAALLVLAVMLAAYF